MIIKGVEVAGIGRFRASTRLAGFGPGVNVLAAPNEAGKSTLYRAVRACFFERHTAAHDGVRRLASSDAALPAQVRVAFSHGGRDYEIEKSFLRGAHASLRRDGAEIAQKSTADEMLWELLGLKPGSGRLKDEAAFGLLWVGQRRSFDLDDMSAGAAHVFSAIVSAEVGGLVGGDRARSVLARVRAELRAHLTEGGKPRVGGPLKAAQDLRDDLREQETALKDRLDALEQDFRALARARAELGRSFNPAERGRLDAELKQAQADYGAARAAADVLARLDLEARLEEGRAGADAERLRHLEEADGRIEASRRRVRRLGEDIARLKGEHAAVQAKVADAAQAVVATESELARLADRTERIARLDKAIEAAERRREWSDRLDQAAALVDRLRTAERELAAIRVTEASVSEASRLRDEIVALAARRDASAPRLAIRLGPGAGERVRLDGAVVDADGSVVLHEAATVMVDGILTLTVTPSMSSASGAVELAETERRLSELLARAGVGSALEARESLARRDGLRREREAIAGRLGLLAPGGAGGEDGLALLHERVAQVTGLVEAALREAGLAELPPPAALAAEAEALKAEADALKARKAGAEAALGDARAAAQQHLTRLCSLKAQAGDEAERLRLDLEAAPDEARAGELDRLRRQMETTRETARRAAAAAALHRLQAPTQDELKRREIKVERLVEAIENHDRRRADLEKEIFTLETGIAAAGGDGLEETHAGIVAEREAADAKAVRLSEDIEALRLLEREIEDTLAQSRERFLAPMKQHLAPFLADFFARADLRLGEDFKPVSLVREALPEGFDVLSDGTREQIAVLVRLALGSMLAARGEPVPLILDDALVFSDDERMERMFDALSRAALAQQVIVLTCRARTFGPLGGHVLTLEPAGA